MPTLLGLPQELRQWIFAAVVHNDELVAGKKTRSARALLRVCKTFRRDMSWVLNSWTSLLSLRKPPAPGRKVAPSWTINGSRCGPKLDCLYLRVFHDAEPRDICLNPWDEVSDVEAWCNAVSKLPSGITTALLDMTPAPFWVMQKRKQDHLHCVVNDRGIAQMFVQRNILHVENLIQRIYEHYEGTAAISLTGTLALGSRGPVKVMIEELSKRGIQVNHARECVSDPDDLPRFEETMEQAIPGSLSRRARSGMRHQN